MQSNPADGCGLYFSNPKMISSLDCKKLEGIPHFPRVQSYPSKAERYCEGATYLKSISGTRWL